MQQLRTRDGRRTAAGSGDAAASVHGHEYTGMLYAAAARDGEVARRLVRPANLLDDPASLPQPEMKQRILALASQTR